MKFIVFALSLFITTAVMAEDWKKVGSGTHKITLLKVYTATLFTPTGKYEPKGPLKLSIQYHISASAKKLTSRTIDEMKETNCSHAEKYSKWQTQMEKVFPDVKSGMTVAGTKKENITSFTANGKSTGTIEGKDFQDCFFGVWLKESTSAPELRKKLLAL